MIRKTISMPDEMGRWIADQLANGRSGNESEYIRDLIRRDQENQRKLADLRTMLAVAEAEVEAGKFTELSSPEDIQRLFDEIDTEIADEAGSDQSRAS